MNARLKVVDEFIAMPWINVVLGMHTWTTSHFVWFRSAHCILEKMPIMRTWWAIPDIFPTMTCGVEHRYDGDKLECTASTKKAGKCGVIDALTEEVR